MSRTLITDKRSKSLHGRRIPAGEIEHLIQDRTHELLKDQAFVFETISSSTEDPTEQNQLLEAIQHLGFEWTNLSANEIRQALLSLIVRIEIQANAVEIKIRPNAFCHLNKDEHSLPAITG